MTTSIASDIVAEALRLVALADDRKLQLRVMGGVAVALHANGGLPAPLRRGYRDIDVVVPRRAERDALALLVAAGYESNERFNSMAGVHGRLVVYDTANGRQLDVFVGEFKMCHALPLAERLGVDAPTIPLAELLLTKLQIVRLNQKDAGDIASIVLGHEIAAHDRDAINGERIASLLAADWGLWRTARGSLERTREILPALGLEPEQRALVERRLAELWQRVEREPKSIRFKARARIGDRTQWYEEPDEIEHRELGG